MIVEKMKNQLHEKGIDSLDRIFIAVQVLLILIQILNLASRS